jgi:hypothetical protein
MHVLSSYFAGVGYDTPDPLGCLKKGIFESKNGILVNT